MEQQPRDACIDRNCPGKGTSILRFKVEIDLSCPMAAAVVSPAVNCSFWTWKTTIPSIPKAFQSSAENPTPEQLWSSIEITMLQIDINSGNYIFFVAKIHGVRWRSPKKTNPLLITCGDQILKFSQRLRMFFPNRIFLPQMLLFGCWISPSFFPNPWDPSHHPTGDDW